MSESDPQYLRSDIVFAEMRKSETVFLPQLQCSVVVREISAGQSMSISDPFVRLAACLFDESGNQIFKTDADVANLREMPVPVFTLLVAAYSRVSNASVEAQEEVLKN